MRVLLASYAETQNPEWTLVGMYLQAASRTKELLYWYPPVGPWWTSGVHEGYAKPKYIQTIEQNIPEGMVALREAAKVIGSDGEFIGDVERILTDSVENRATHLVVSKDIFLKNTKLVPSRWITGVLENEIELAVASDLVENLSDYNPED